MCDYLVTGCGGSGQNETIDTLIGNPIYKDPQGNYWDIAGIVQNIPKGTGYTAFNLYKGVTLGPARHMFRTIKAGTGVTIAYDNESGDVSNSLVISSTGGGGGTTLPTPTVAKRTIIYDITPTAGWEEAAYGQGLDVTLGTPHTISFVGGDITLSQNTVFKTATGYSLTLQNKATSPTASISLSESSGNIVIRTNNSVGTNGQVLTSNGTSAVWQTPSGGGSTYTAGQGIDISVGNVISIDGGPINLSQATTISMTGANALSIQNATTSPTVALGITGGNNKLSIRTDNSTGISGQYLSADGSGGTVWATFAPIGIIDYVPGVGMQFDIVGPNTEVNFVGGSIDLSSNGLNMFVNAATKKLLLSNKSTLATAYVEVSFDSNRLAIKTNNSLGTGGQALVSDGSGRVMWGTPTVSTPGLPDIGVGGGSGKVIVDDGTGGLGLQDSGDTLLESLDKFYDNTGPHANGDIMVPYVDENGPSMLNLNDTVAANVPSYAEFSYRFESGLLEVEDYFINGVNIQQLGATAGINTSSIEVSVDGNPYAPLVLPFIIPPTSMIRFKIAYNLLYNSGSLTFTGFRIVP